MERKMQRSFGNIGMLDLRRASEESLAGQSISAGNVGMALVSPATRHLLGLIQIGNIGNVVEVSDEARFVQGDSVIEASTLGGNPLNLVVVGTLQVRPDVTPEDLRSGVKALAVVGTVICPAPLEAVLREKLTTHTGILFAYRGAPRFVHGACALTESFLAQCATGTELLVLGKLTVPQVLPEGRIGERISRISLLGKAVWHEENDTEMRALLESGPNASKVEVIPRGFARVDEILFLDADSIDQYANARLDCREGVIVRDDLNAEDFERAIQALHVEGFLVCPGRLKGAVRDRCRAERTLIVTYSGELEIIEDDGTLLESRFRFAKKKLTVVALGNLSLDPLLAPETLFESVEKAVLLGDTSCTHAQAGALRARLALNRGDVQIVSEGGRGETPEDAGENASAGTIGNIGHLVL